MAEEFVAPYEGRIVLDKTIHGWVAKAPARRVSSAPFPDRATALDDLDEVVALDDGRLELDPDLLAELEETREELYEAHERGELTTHAELKRELNIEE